MENTAGNAEGGFPLPRAAVAAFVGAAMLSALTYSRSPGWRYEPNPAAQEGSAAAQIRSDVKVAVLAFESAEPKNAVRRASGERGPELVYELGVESHSWPRLDGKAFGSALAKELEASGLFSGASFMESPVEFEGVGVVVSGKVVESALHRPEGKKGSYFVELALSARVPGRFMDLQQITPFWEKTLKKKLAASGGPPYYDLNELLRGVYADVAGELGKAYQEEMAKRQKAAEKAREAVIEERAGGEEGQTSRRQAGEGEADKRLNLGDSPLLPSGGGPVPVEKPKVSVPPMKP